MVEGDETRTRHPTKLSHSGSQGLGSSGASRGIPTRHLNKSRAAKFSAGRPEDCKAKVEQCWEKALLEYFIATRSSQI